MSSSSIVNYDFNSNTQKIKLENGIPGLVPVYYKYYNVPLGPLGSFENNTSMEVVNLKMAALSKI